MSEGRSWVAKAVFEAALIVFSIVFGLAVNGWRESMQARRRMQEIRAAFTEEIRANRDQLSSDAYAPLHRKLAAAVGKLAALPAPTKEDRARALKDANTGLHPFHPRDAVWTAFAHGELVASMAPAELLALAEIYRAQDDLREINRTLIATLTTATAEAETPAFLHSQAEVLGLTLNDVAADEARLLAMYQRALQ